jgi:hypothetical protein
MSLVLNSDFTGKYQLALTQYNTAEIDAYIAKYEKKYLLELLGASLYALFIADLDASTPQVPQTSTYLSLYNAFNADFDYKIKSSNGMREMLLGFIYYHYTKDIVQNQTPIGSTKPKNENSSVMGLNQSMTSRFNDQVDTYESIQWYISDNLADYTGYNGQTIKFEYFL